MHLIEKAEQGQIPPSSLPQELHPSSTTSQTASMPGEHTRRLSEESFKPGRTELERKKEKALQEQMEKEAVSA